MKLFFRRKKRFNYRNFQLHHKILFTLIGLVGVVLVWRGIWTFFDWAHLLEHPVASTAVGLVLVGISGAFFSMF